METLGIKIAFFVFGTFWGLWLGGRFAEKDIIYKAETGIRMFVRGKCYKVTEDSDEIPSS